MTAGWTCLDVIFEITTLVSINSILVSGCEKKFGYNLRKFSWNPNRWLDIST